MTWADIALEEKEKEKRKLNLTIHHIPESNLAESYDRKREDMDNLAVLFNKYVGVKYIFCHKCNKNWQENWQTKTC